VEKLFFFSGESEKRKERVLRLTFIYERAVARYALRIIQAQLYRINSFDHANVCMSTFRSLPRFVPRECFLSDALAFACSTGKMSRWAIATTAAVCSTALEAAAFSIAPAGLRFKKNKRFVTVAYIVAKQKNALMLRQLLSCEWSPR
jgi:hypothetical protein